MGSESIPRKHHYDITMSKRTRKPNTNLKNQETSENHHQNLAEKCIIKGNNPVKINQVVNEVCDQRVRINDDDDEDKKSLKELIKRSSLKDHFTAEEEENNEQKQNEQMMQIVVMKQSESNGVRFKHMVSRYTKVLSQMVRIKRDSNKKQLPPFRLKSHQFQKS